MANAIGAVRDHWSGRAAFVLAAIGSAVGLGNLWGFPYKLYTYGGGAFLIPYFIAMLLIGIPLLIMEFSVGHWAQNSPPGAFAKVLKRYKFVGWWLVLLAFVIITYYAVVLGWCVNFTVESVTSLVTGNALPWAGGVEQAAKHFEKDLVGAGSGFNLTGLSWPVVIGMVASWVLIYLCLFRGVGWVSKVVLLTVPLPWIMLVVLTVRGLTLDGALNGLEFYLEPQWEKLAEPATWRFAFGQVFFSLSLGFAVMLSYASFLHRRSDLNNNAMIIGLGDLGTSFIAGIAVFATLGGMSMVTGQPVERVTSGGPGLAFVAFPYALAELPAAALFSTIFFVALLTLGIDSAFSIVEACLASICDQRQRWPRAVVLPVICVVGMAIGLLYCGTNGGINWLGLTDGLINGPFGIIVVALAETLIVGWAWRGRFVGKMRHHANDRSDWKLYGWWDVIIKYVAPAFLTVLFVWNVDDFIRNQFAAAREATEAEPYALPWAEIGGMVLFIIVPIVCALVAWPRGERAEPTDERGGGVMYGVIFSAIVGLVSVAVIEVLHGYGVFSTTERVKEADGQLDTTAYVLVAAVMVAIFGGLAWCFWRAVQAAGGGDTEIQDEPSI